MIPYMTCVCFGGHGRGKMKRWILVQGGVQRRSGIVIDKTNDNTLYIRVLDQKEEETEKAERRPTTLSSSEYCLLECLSDTDHRLTPGPFLTPQTRRAKVPISKPQLARLSELDDAYNGIVDVLLTNCNKWNFNTFNLDVSTGGRSLPILLVHLFQDYGLIKNFNLDVSRIWHCFSLIEENYHSNNPYHNSVHAADVTQAMHCFLQENKILQHLTPLEAMASLIASVTHDVDHPGVNQPFLIATSNHLASLYKNFSVLENHHWRTAISCLKESGIFDHIDRESWDEIEWYIRSLILATDITRQQEFLSRFKRYLDTGILDMAEKEYRHFILQIALKCADLCNPCRPWEISKRWSYQVCQEFYRQGDYERQLNLPVTPLCDRTKTTVAKIQADFFKFVVTPLFEIWHRFLETSLSQQLLDNLSYNHNEWRIVVEREEKLKIKPIIEPEGCSTADEEELDEVNEHLGPNTDESFLSGDEDSLNSSWGRRHSMPLSVPKMLPRTTIRRQSFPRVIHPLTVTPESEGFSSFPLHRSPNISLRTLSAEHLQPKATIMSLSRSTRMSLLRKMDIAAEVERRLVHQPVSYPPYMMPITSSKIKPEVSPEAEDKAQSDMPETTCSDSKKESDSESNCTNGCCSSESSRIGSINDVSPISTVERQSVRSSFSSSALEPLALSCIKDCLETKVINVMQHSSSESTSLINEKYLSSNDKPRKLIRLKSESDMLKNEINVSPSAFSVHQKPNISQFEPHITSWCSHISRSLSAERSQPQKHDFDSSMFWKGSVNSLSSGSMLRRRGSAPVAFRTGQLSNVGDIVETRGGLRGGTSNIGFGRRWSIPTEPSEVLLSNQDLDDQPTIPSPIGHRPLQKELVRRHSFGLLEPFLSIHSSESECDGSSTEPTSTGTTCSTRRSSAVPGDCPRKSFSSRGTVYTESNETEESICSESHDLFYPCFLSNRTLLSKRRGSLPTDIPISLMCRVPPVASTTSNRTRLPSKPSFEELKRGCGDDVKSPDIDWDQTRRRGSAGEILCALIGSARTFATLQGIVTASADNVPNSSTAQPSTHSLPRRGSGGLELFSGFWRSRTTDISADLLPSTGRFILPRQSYSVDSHYPESFFRGSRSDQQLCTNVSLPLVNQGGTSGISAIEERLLCQPRRGSVPLEVSFLSLLTGKTTYRDK